MNYDEILGALDAVDADSRIARHGADCHAPDRKAVIGILKDLQALLFPGYFRGEAPIGQRELLARVEACLTSQITCSLRFRDAGGDPGALCEAFLSRLPAIKSALIKDAEALYLGDPAAKCREEILLCYPGFYAISIYRMAHELYRLEVPLLPRIMTEYAHEKTGIDIHAGARIGDYFFIDHGTGIVIGETTVIGHHVKLYQGVTLGAKSFETDADGNPIKNIKRHPNIGNHVVIYAGATILGGSTTVGDGCVIGGNVWLTHSIPAGQIVYYKEK